MSATEKQTSRSKWKEVLPHREGIYLNDFEVFQEFIVLEDQENGLIKLRVINQKDETIDEKKQQYQAKINKYRRKIKQYEGKINDYFLENYNDLFQYFEIKKDIETNNNPKKLIHRFFDKTRNNEMMNEREYNHCIETYMRKNNFDVYHQEYLNPDENVEICTKCNKGEMIQSSSDGVLICNHCHVFIKYLIHNDKPTYKEPPKEVCFYAYKRINHFR